MARFLPRRGGTEVAGLHILAVGPPHRLASAREVILRVGHSYDGVPHFEGLLERVRRASPDVVLYDWGEGGRDSLECLDAVCDLEDAPGIILLTDPAPPPDVLALLERAWFTQALALEAPWFAEELAVTLSKVSGGPIFGLARSLPANAELHELEVTGSEDKAAVLQRLSDFVGRIGVHSRVVSMLATIADELFTNAVYDAPVGPEGPRYRDWPRTRRVDLAPDERPIIRFGSDGRVFGISATDPFGNLGSEALRHYIVKGLRRGADQIDQRAGGAGLGLFFLYDRANSFCVHRSPGRRSEIIILLDVRGSYRDALQCPKSYLVFEGDDP